MIVVLITPIKIIIIEPILNTRERNLKKNVKSSG